VIEDKDALDATIERWMRERPSPSAPPHFRPAVMSRVRQERWRIERYWDLGFNLAVGVGVIFIAAGVFGLAHLSGLSAVGRDAIGLFADAVTTTAVQAAPTLPLYMGGFLLTAAAVGLWWFVEG
jgi:hypothetical protein